MSRKKYDCIVIGGGHNGLTTAALLAKRGKKVVLLEQNRELGGLAEGFEFHPGYRTPGIFNDTSLVRKRVLNSLRLPKFGLEYSSTPPSVLIPEQSGRGLVIDYDPDAAAAEIGKISEKDARAYHGYRKFFDNITPFVRSIFDDMPPDVYGMNFFGLLDLMKKAVALRLLGKKDMMEILRIGPMCVADWLNEWFESDLLKAGLAGPAVFGDFTGPWSPSTNANLILHETMRQGQVIGGGAALIDALTKCAQDAGVEIRTASAVKAVNVNDERATGVTLTDGTIIESSSIAASCDPKTVFLELIDSVHVPFQLQTRMKQFRARGTTAKIHLALNQPLYFNSRPGLKADYARTGRSLDHIERAFDAIKYRRCSAHPILDIYQPTFQDPALAPPGHAVISVMVHYAPHNLEEGWSESTKQLLAERVIEELDSLSTNFKDLVVAKEVLSPLDIADRYRIAHGNLFHGEHAADQIIQRPTPETSQYRTPVRGLYLCGSGSHPGGGLTCAPGSLAALAIGK